MFSRIFLFVEGPDDTRFFESIIKPELEEEYEHVQIVPYQNDAPIKINSFIRDVGNTPDSDYLFFRDLDRTPCITSKKLEVQSRYPDVSLSKILIVVPEIEAWYLAGLTSEGCTGLGIKFLYDCNDLTKERLESMIPRRFDSRVDFLRQILNSYSVAIAGDRSQSLAYFINRFLLSRPRS